MRRSPVVPMPWTAEAVHHHPNTAPIKKTTIRHIKSSAKRANRPTRRSFKDFPSWQGHLSHAVAGQLQLCENQRVRSRALVQTSCHRVHWLIHTSSGHCGNGAGPHGRGCGKRAGAANPCLRTRLTGSLMNFRGGCLNRRGWKPCAGVTRLKVDRPDDWLVQTTSQIGSVVAVSVPAPARS
jgi:hypothetical protein